MKNIILLFLFVLSSIIVTAQAPQGINYQGVARDHQGKPLASQSIAVRISILKNTANGDLEFSETHSLQTNPFGLFTLVIGKGNAVSGSFNFISWADGNKWMQVELDPAGGSSFQVIGSQQLMSVPYALYAEYSRNGLTAGQGISIDKNAIINTGDSDNNPTNELNTGLTLDADHKLKITDAGGTKEADLSSLLGARQNLSNVLQLGNDAGAQKITNLSAPTNTSDAATKSYVDNHNDADANSTNEIQDLNLTGNTLKITNNATATPIDFTPYLNTDNQNLSNVLQRGNDAGAQKITNLGLPVAATDATTKSYVDAHNDADANSANEIQDLNLTGNILKITNNASATAIDLSAYVNTDNQNLTSTISGTQRTINISGGSGTTIDVADNDNSITNEIQDLSIASNILKVTNNASATSISLLPYLDNTDSQNLTNSVTGTQRTITISGGSGTTIDVADNDNSITNEIQDLSIASNILKVTNNASATSISLLPYLDNTDSQNLTNSVTGTQRTINISGGSGTTIDVADNDNSITNEIQDLSIASNTLKVTNNASATAISLTPYLDNTDSQNLTNSVSGTQRTINISGGTGTTIDVADNDNSITNEIQDLSLSANTLKVTNNASATAISLTPYLDNTDSQNLTNSVSGTQRTINISGGTGTTIDVADNDNSIINEIQDLSLSANTLKVTNNASATAISLTPYLDNTDSQNLGNSASGTQRTITISGGTGTTIDVANSLSQVLTKGNDAGTTTINNLGTPVAANDATTKKYVDDADAALAAKIATTYAFKTAFSYTNTAGVIENNKIMPFTSEDFDDFNVLGLTNFTANENGTYVFTVDGSHESVLGAGASLSLLYNGTKFPFSIIPPWGGGAIARFNSTLMFKLTAGQTVSLVADNILIGGKFSGNFFGYKL